MGIVAAIKGVFGGSTPRSRVVSGAGTRIVNGAIQSLDQNADLQGRKWYGSPYQLGVSGRMMRDGHVRQSISYRTAPLCNATWRFRPASKEPIDREAADFANWAFLERLPWEHLTRRIVASFHVNGFSLNEMTDDWSVVPSGRFPLHPGGGRGIVPTGVHEIPAWSVNRWAQSRECPTSIAGIEQFIQGSDGERAGYRFIPAERILRWTLDQEGANFEGLPLLRSAYAAYKMKIAFLTIAAIKHERRGVGTPVAIQGENASDAEIDAAEEALAEMRANARGHLVLPNGWTFKWEGGSQSDETNIEIAIDMCNRDFAVNASAGFMMLGMNTSSSGGSYALGATQQGQYHLAVAGDARFYTAGWNLGFDGWSPVERIIRLNYGDKAGMPILEARNLPTSNWSERIPLLINAANVGLITPDAHTEDELREALEFDPHDPETARPRAGQQVEMLKTARDKNEPRKSEEKRDDTESDDDGGDAEEGDDA
jgi:hypothetical protein